MRYISVCSGIEAASVAWEPLGWKPAAFSEIEKFPCRVLKHRFPDVPNRGDMTKFEEWPDEPVDLLVGGTPCQSFSVAGRRQGMDDPRGQLAFAYAGILAKYRPRWLVWENVPGVLSSNKGRDFAAFVGELVKLGYGVCWRMLGAQHFGVPQRRKRIFAVGYLGDWRPAAAVLFERQSRPGDFAPCRKTGEGVAKPTIVGALTSSLSKGLGHNKDDMICIDKPIATLTARFAKGHGYDGQDINAGLPHLLVSNTVTAKWATGSGGPAGDECQNLVLSTQNPTAIAIRTANTGANGHGVADEKSHTLDGANGQAVAFHATRRDGGRILGDLSPTVEAQWGTGGGNVPAITREMQVRRLTPKECERLQGFPDDWTNIPTKGKDCPDGPRYKALGNSMAVPVMAWIGRRLAMVANILEGNGNAG